MGNLLIWHRDSSCDMEQLELNGQFLGGGNTWDNNCEDRFEAVKLALDTLGVQYSAVVDNEWKYAD